MQICHSPAHFELLANPYAFQMKVYARNLPRVEKGLFFALMDLVVPFAAAPSLVRVPDFVIVLR
jgi:hypothetical protein